jgi:organic radical activating enzyme
MIPGLQQTKDRLNQVGPGFCLAKFYEVGMHLETGRIHSCIHPRAQQIPQQEVLANFHALHNSQHVRQVRQDMLNQQRPQECGYCWRLEDADPEIFSDRVFFSRRYQQQDLDRVLTQGANHNYFPTHAEISFSITCNFKCVYCAPQVSSQWLRDLSKSGPYKHGLWTLERMKEDNEIPISDQDHNPYVQAFWKWLPEAYSHLWSLRVTGGEPLLNPNTYSVIDWARRHANPRLQLGINTNLGVPDLLIDRLCQQLKDLVAANTVQSVTVWTSGESAGSRFEYQRHGGHYDQWRKNIVKILDADPQIRVRIMTTYNVLSVTGYLEFLQDMQKIHQIYGDRFVVDSHTYLQYPRHLSVDILTADFVNYIEPQVEFVRQHLDVHSQHRAERLLQYFRASVANPSPSLGQRRREFYDFVHEYDARTGTDFTVTFPELTDFLLLCGQ